MKFRIVTRAFEDTVCFELQVKRAWYCLWTEVRCEWVGIHATETYTERAKEKLRYLAKEEKDKAEHVKHIRKTSKKIEYL